MRLRLRDISPFIFATSSSDRERSYNLRAKLSNESNAPERQKHDGSHDTIGLKIERANEKYTSVQVHGEILGNCM